MVEKLFQQFPPNCLDWSNERDSDSVRSERCQLLLGVHFALVRDWEHRVVLWLVKVWCCMLGEPVPLGLYWDALPQLDRLFRSTTGVGSFEIKPLVLSDLSRTILDVSGQVLGGTDMHVVLNHLQKRVKGFVKILC